MNGMILEQGKTRLYKLLYAVKGLRPEQMDLLLEEALCDVAAIALKGKRFLTEKEVSAKYPISLGYWRLKREKGGGPTYHKFGNSRNSPVYYRQEDLEHWIENNRATDPFLARALAQR